MRSPTVDVHAHAIVPEVESVVAGHPDLVRQRIPQLVGVERRLSDMTAAGIDIQMVSPSPSQYHYWADEELSRTVTACAHRGIAVLVAEEPSRLTGLGLIPLQHPDLAVDALNDAVLACGLRGVEISSFAPTADGTVELSHPGLEPSVSGR